MKAKNKKKIGWQVLKCLKTWFFPRITIWQSRRDGNDIFSRNDRNMCNIFHRKISIIIAGTLSILQMTLCLCIGFLYVFRNNIRSLYRQSVYVICFISMGFHLFDGLLMNSYSMVCVPECYYTLLLLHDHFPFSIWWNARVHPLWHFPISNHTHIVWVRYTQFSFSIFYLSYIWNT